MTTERNLVLSLEDLKIVEEVVQRHVPDRPVFAFGSRTRGRARRLSDLDLAVGGDTPLPPGLHYDLKESFTESDLRILVDVIDLHDVDPGFRKRIEPDFVPLHLPKENRA